MPLFDPVKSGNLREGYQAVQKKEDYDHEGGFIPLPSENLRQGYKAVEEEQEPLQPPPSPPRKVESIESNRSRKTTPPAGSSHSIFEDPEPDRGKPSEMQMPKFLQSCCSCCKGEGMGMGMGRRNILILSWTLCLEIFLVVAWITGWTSVRGDREWNAIMDGERPFPPLVWETSYFYKKTLDIPLDEWSVEKHMLHRGTILFSFYLFIIFVALIATLVQVGTLCITSDFNSVGQPWSGIYFGMGVALLLGFGCAIQSTSKIESDHFKVIKQLESHMNWAPENRIERGAGGMLKQAYKDTPFVDLDEVLMLHDILGVCLKTSHYASWHLDTKLLQDLPASFTMNDGHEYGEKELTHLRFCQLEGRKITSIIMGVLCMILAFLMSGANVCIHVFETDEEFAKRIVEANQSKNKGSAAQYERMQ